MGRLEDNIKMDLQAMKWKRKDWIDVTEDGHRQQAVVNEVMNHRVP
jgi:hypothetical protein